MSAHAPSSESRIDERFAIEATAIGPQSLVPGVVPITVRDRLLCRAAAPLAPKKPQRGCDHGLFDLAARDQLDLFRAVQPSREGEVRPAPEPSNKER